MELDGQRRHALVHHSQVSEELVFGKDDEDADKVAAMEYFCRPGSRVGSHLPFGSRRIWEKHIAGHTSSTCQFRVPP